MRELCGDESFLGARITALPPAIPTIGCKTPATLLFCA